MIALLMGTKWGKDNMNLAIAIGSAFDVFLALAIISLIQKGV